MSERREAGIPRSSERGLSGPLGSSKSGQAGPIEGLRGPHCSRGPAGRGATGMLADYGPDVVWIEPPAGGPLRARAPEHVADVDRGRRRVALDLANPAALEQILELAD